jgi:hypothetical protein
MEEAKKVALRLALLPAAIAVKQNKGGDQSRLRYAGLVATLKYGQEMFCLTSMGQQGTRALDPSRSRTPPNWHSTVSLCLHEELS